MSDQLFCTVMKLENVLLQDRLKFLVVDPHMIRMMFGLGLVDRVSSFSQGKGGSCG